MKEILIKDRSIKELIGLSVGSYMLFKSKNYVDFVCNNEQMIGQIENIYQNSCVLMKNDTRIFYFEHINDAEDLALPIPLTKEWAIALCSQARLHETSYQLQTIPDIRIVDRTTLRPATSPLMYVHSLQTYLELLTNEKINLSTFDKKTISAIIKIKIL